VNRDADHPSSSEVGDDTPADEGDERLEIALDGLLDWGSDPAKPEEELDKVLEAQSAEALVAAERDEYLDSLRRLQADFDNFRKRSLRQQTELLEHATEGLCMKLLPVLDAFDLAMSHLATQAESNDAVKALGQLDALLRDVLAREGLERIDAVGVPFDPTVHDAVGHMPSQPAPGPDDQAQREPAPDGGDTAAEPTAAPEHLTRPAKAALAPAQSDGPSVAQVMRAGYRMRSKVLRPAMVLVGD
jgi:molecular chaperone GrpE